MARKRALNPAELLAAALGLQVRILDALFSSRAWRTDEIAFQGRTSLKLAHGSVRFSEDLDFLLAEEMADNVIQIAESALARVRETMAIDAPEDSITLRVGRRSGNTLPFTFVRASERFRNSIRVKVDFQLVPKILLESYQKELVTFALPPQLRAGVKAMLPAATLDSVYADKILAIAGRPYLKPRDFFDLWWLRTQQGVKGPSEQGNLVQRIGTAAAMYGKTPNATLLPDW
jgi:predicted nucleotidyltransferase component of viral defense system